MLDFLKSPLGIYSKWYMCLISIMIILGGFMHLDSTLGGTDWCKDDQHENYNCIGDSLVWKKSGNGVEDTNEKWRETFTFRPNKFVDTWTPFFYGFAAFLQNFSSMKNDTLVGSWARCLAFYLFGSFWAVFGYAGNWGVFWGFAITVGLCPVLLLLSIIDKENFDTHIDLIVYLHSFGLTAAPQPKQSEGEEVRPPPAARNGELLSNDQQQMDYAVAVPAFPDGSDNTQPQPNAVPDDNQEPYI